MSEQPTSLITTQVDGVMVVKFRDASILDAVTTQQVARELYALIEGGDAAKVVLDFEQVRFLSSQTLGVLLTLRRKADKAKVKIALAAIRPELKRVFEITNLDKLFGFYKTGDEAVEALGGE